jgi:hypothetical protein
MLLKIAQDSTAIAIVRDGQLLLFRILEGAETGALNAERIADDIYPSLVYFQDTYSMAVEQLLVSGVQDLGELSHALAEQTGVEVKELIGAGLVSGKLRNDFAGAIGALL